MILNQVWDIGERKFKADFCSCVLKQSRFRSASVRCGNVGTQGERRSGTTTVKVHQMDTRIGYKNTGLHSARGKEERRKIRVRAGRRALSFVERIREGTLVLKECFKE